MVLIFGKPKKRAKPQGNPPWLTWSVTLIIAYMLFNHYTEKKNKSMQPATQEEVVAKVTDTSPEPTIPAVIADTPAPEPAITPSLPTGVTIGGDIAGHGEAALCGMEMVLLVDTLFPEGSGREGEIKKEIRVRAGITTDTPWVAALEGMKIGGVRQINMPAEMAVPTSELTKELGANDVVQYKVELQRLIPSLAQDELQYYHHNVAEGQGDRAACGKKVAFHAVLWGKNGKKLYDSAAAKEAEDTIPLETVIGLGEYFYGLDATLIGMKEGGTRFAVIPPAYAAIADKAENWKKYLPAGQHALLEVNLLTIE
jgi:FKBP-type peptidyl-prolyl cis-trans isomerase